MTCPNCGGPVTGDICEYCGTVFTDIRKIKNTLKQEIFKQYLFSRQNCLNSEILTYMDEYRKENNDGISKEM